MVEGEFRNGEMVEEGVYEADGQVWRGRFFENLGAVGLRCSLCE